MGLLSRLTGKAPTGLFNQNSAQAAWGMLTGIQPGAIGAPPVRGTAEYLKAYSEMPWLRAVAARVASATASAEWQLYVRKRTGEKGRRDFALQRATTHVRRKALLKQAKMEEDLTEITEHPLLDVLHSANSFQTGEQMRKTTQLHLDLVGEAFWLKERDGLGVVVAVWPVPPNWVVNTPTPTNPFYRVNFRGWRGLIPDTEMLWFSDPDPANPYVRGSGSTQALGDELETDEYAAKHTKAFFYNRARPDILVWPKVGQVRQEQVQRLEEDWLARAQGFWKAFKPYFLTREVGVHEMDQNFRSLQLVQLREFERDSIMQMFGIPPELLGVLEHSNRATIEAADYLFSRYVVQPRLEFLRSILQERLVPEYDERLILDYVSPVQDDKELQLKAAQAMPAVPTVDEWREKAGLPPLADDKGKVHLFSGGVREHTMGEEDPVPVGFDPDTRRPLVPFDPDAAARPPEAEDEDDKAWRKDLRSAALDAPGDGELQAGLYKAAGDDAADLPEPAAVAARQEPAFARMLVRAWARGAESLSLEHLAGMAQRGDEEGLSAALSRAEDGVPGEARDHLHRAFVRGAQVGAAPLRAMGVAVRAVDLDLLQSVNPAAVAWARRHAGALVQAGERTRERVRRLVAAAEEDGLTPDEVARALRGVVGLLPQQAEAVRAFRRRLRADGVEGERLAARVARYAEAQRRHRAWTIARTELIAATNAGQQELWSAAVRAGAVRSEDLRKQWLVTYDERLEPVCEGLGAMDPVPVEGTFGGYDHPPAHPNCRCSVGLVSTRRSGR